MNPMDDREKDNFPAHLRQLAITGCQSNEEELIGALCSAADEIQMYHNLIQMCDDVQTLFSLLVTRHDPEW